jgi:hypothetical protein
MTIKIGTNPYWNREILVSDGLGRVVAQAASRRLTTGMARVGTRVKSRGICGGQSGTGEGYLRVLRFPLPLIHSTNCSTTITIYRPGLVQ